MLQKVADESRVLQRLLDIRPTPDVQRLHFAIRSGKIPLDGATLAIQQRNVRLELRPTRKPQLTRDDELRVC